VIYVQKKEGNKEMVYPKIVLFTTKF